MSGIERLAEFAASASLEAVPASVMEKMRVHLLDTLAAALGGAATVEASRVRAALVDGSAEQSSVWGTGASTSARSAACANGMAASVLELDDTGGCDHSGAVVAPAVLASQQASSPDASLGDVLVTMALGYEVARRVQLALGGYTHLNGAGWHSTSVCGPIGAALAAAKLVGLTQDGIADAIGLASSMMGGGWSFRSGGGDNKALHAGLAAAHGVEAARLAAHGVRGNRHALDDTWGGAGRLFAGEQADLVALTEALGSRWTALDASIKPFASCASAHRMLQLAREQLVPLAIPPGSIDGITIRLGPVVADMCGEARASQLADFTQRQLSIPYGIALTLVHGAAELSALRQAPAAHPAVEALLERTTVLVDDSIVGAHGDGTLMIDAGGAQTVHSTEHAADPRGLITSSEAVLVKAEQTLLSMGVHHHIDTLQRIAGAPLSTLARDVFAGL